MFRWDISGFLYRWTLERFIGRPTLHSILVTLRILDDQYHVLQNACIYEVHLRLRCLRKAKNMKELEQYQYFRTLHWVE